jgi:hypothetical protein
MTEQEKHILETLKSLDPQFKEMFRQWAIMKMKEAFEAGRTYEAHQVYPNFEEWYKNRYKII